MFTQFDLVRVAVHGVGSGGGNVTVKWELKFLRSLAAKGKTLCSPNQGLTERRKIIIMSAGKL